MSLLILKSSSFVHWFLGQVSFGSLFWSRSFNLFFRSLSINFYLMLIRIFFQFLLAPLISDLSLSEIFSSCTFLLPLLWHRPGPYCRKLILCTTHPFCCSGNSFLSTIRFPIAWGLLVLVPFCGVNLHSNVQETWPVCTPFLLAWLVIFLVRGLCSMYLAFILTMGTFTSIPFWSSHHLKGLLAPTLAM